MAISGTDGRRAAWLAFAGYLVLTLFWFRPVWSWLGSAVTPDAGDPWFNLYVLDWGYESLLRGFDGVWNPPFFHPTPGVLAFSDHLLGPAVLTAPLRAAGAPVTVAYNVLVLASFVLGGFFAYLLCRRHGVSALGAFAAGLIYVAAPFRWDQLSHLAILMAQWLPLMLWAWDELLTRPDWRRAAAFLAIYAVHVTGGTSLAYLGHLPLTILALVHLRTRQGPLRSPRSWRVIAPTLLLAGGIAAAVFVPYVVIGSDLGLQRSSGEIRRLGAIVPSFLVPSHQNLYFSYDLWGSLRRGEDSLFPGFAATTLLAAAAVVYFRRRRGAAPAPPLGWRRRGLLVAAGLVCLLGWTLADVHTLTGDRGFDWLGRNWRVEGYTLPRALIVAGGVAAVALFRRFRGAPTRRWRDLPAWDQAMLLTSAVSLLLCFPAFYLPVSEVVSGLRGMRVTSRLFAIALLPLAYFAGRSLDRLGGLGRPAALAVGSLAVVVLLFESTPRRLEWVPVPAASDLPAVYHWLARQRAVSGVLELPFGRTEPDEIAHMLHQRVHRKPLANGYSGYLAPSFLELRRGVAWPLTESAQFDLLREKGISHVVVGRMVGQHVGRWRPRSGRLIRLAPELTSGPDTQAELLYEDRSHLVYGVAPAGPRGLAPNRASGQPPRPRDAPGDGAAPAGRWRSRARPTPTPRGH